MFRKILHAVWPPTAILEDTGRAKRVSTMSVRYKCADTTVPGQHHWRVSADILLPGGYVIEDGINVTSRMSFHYPFDGIAFQFRAEMRRRYPK